MWHRATKFDVIGLHIPLTGFKLRIYWLRTKGQLVDLKTLKFFKTESGHLGESCLKFDNIPLCLV